MPFPLYPILLHIKRHLCIQFMKTVVVLQSAYIPWKGYFHLIHEADLFVFHDDLQYTRSDWRNRNRIVTPTGAAWLTIPAGADEKRLICDVEIENQSWKTRHRRIIEQNYCRDCRKRLKTFTDGLVLFENASRFFRNDAIREV